jgi:5'(3')-deoxyribonucleotidase
MNKATEICFLDMDGVLANFNLSMSKLFNVSYSAMTQRQSWGIHQFVGITKMEMWALVDLAGKAFWANMEPYPWVPDLLLAIDKRFGLDHTYLLTDPGHSTNSPSGKQEWVNTNLPEILHDNLIITQHKHLLAGANRVLIDDRDKNCDQFIEACGGAIIFPQPWNRMRNVAVEAVIRDIGE